MRSHSSSKNINCTERYIEIKRLQSLINRREVNDLCLVQISLENTQVLLLRASIRTGTFYNFATTFFIASAGSVSRNNNIF